MGIAAAGLLVLPSAAGATIEVTGATLRVTLGTAPAPTQGNGVQVHALAGGGAIVSLHGSVNSGDQSVGAGCQQVGNANAGAMPSNFPGAGSADFVATCDLTNVRVVEGQLRNSGLGNQGWLSGINLPTNVTTTSNSGPAAGQTADRSPPATRGTASPGATRRTPLTLAARRTRARRHSPRAAAPRSTTRTATS